MKWFCFALIVLGVAGCSRSVEKEQPLQAPAETAAPAPVTAEPLPPPYVERGQPGVYTRTEHDPRPFMEKTQPDKVNLWFKFPNDEHWYIDWDAERKPFDLIVIHHTATSPTTTAESIDTGQKDRLYVPRYQSENDDPYVKGLPPNSGHVVNGKERFGGYHHLVYEDGRVTTELSPLVKINETWFVDMVGWHTGTWEVNCRSLGICLVGDFTDQEPPEPQLTATARLIAYYKTRYPQLQVQPHQALSRTECPGRTWRVWSKKLQAE